MINYKKKILSSKLDQESAEIFRQIEKLKFPKGFLEFVNYVISELFSNIKEHSKAKSVVIEININKKNCLIKIADNGIGLKRSYSLKKINPKDDFAAIEFALSGLSTKDFQERGFGLYSIKKLIYFLKGETNIETGFAKAVIKTNKIIFKKNPKKIQGLVVLVKTRIKAIDFYKAVE